jgi:serine/threonine protein kinase
MARPGKSRARQSPAPARLHEIHRGERVDDFRVGGLLHEGGMARLYRVTQARHTSPLVLKVPKLGPEAPRSAYAAFEHEVELLTRLKGAPVPRFIAAGDPHTTPYLVMEYIDGDDLARAARRAPVSVAELCDLGIRLCRAVHALHRHNVIHLDLNPANVRNRANGDMVLIDLGLAHYAAWPDRLDTAFDEAEGTTPYIAPEQLHHVRNESRSDIYAVGAILYQLATGQYPFGRPNLLSLRKRLIQPPVPPRLYNAALPPWLQEIILRCLEIRPEARYATAKQVAYLLAHPEAVALTRRGHRTRRADVWTRARLWWRSLHQVFDEGEPVRPYEHIATHPHVLVALDLTHASEALKEALRNTVRRMARNEPHSYFTCLSVVTGNEAARRRGGRAVAASALSLAGLHHWAEPLRLAPERMVFQVVAGEAGTAIVEYARQHVVDHIILGARGSSALRRFLGSVSSKVAAQAACTVTVVRSRRDPHAPSRR